MFNNMYKTTYSIKYNNLLYYDFIYRDQGLP